jgi:hypothetical protein
VNGFGKSAPVCDITVVRDVILVHIAQEMISQDTIPVHSGNNKSEALEVGFSRFRRVREDLMYINKYKNDEQYEDCSPVAQHKHRPMEVQQAQLGV